MTVVTQVKSRQVCDYCEWECLTQPTNRKIQGALGVSLRGCQSAHACESSCDSAGSAHVRIFLADVSLLQNKRLSRWISARELRLCIGVLGVKVNGRCAGYARGFEAWPTPPRG